MLNLQLGVRFSVGGVEARQETPTLKAKDFQLTVRPSRTRLNPMSFVPQDRSAIDCSIYAS